MAKNLKKEILGIMSKLKLSDNIIKGYKEEAKIYCSKPVGNKIELLDLSSSQLQQVKEIETDTKKVIHVLSDTSDIEIYLIWTQYSQDEWSGSSNGRYRFYIYGRNLETEYLSEYGYVFVQALDGGLVKA